jgi:hypothetical protein
MAFSKTSVCPPTGRVSPFANVLAVADSCDIERLLFWRRMP